jgi:hypothetical protein
MTNVAQLGIFLDAKGMTRAIVKPKNSKKKAANSFKP